MLKSLFGTSFLGGSFTRSSNRGGDGLWPQARIVDVLKRQYDEVRHLGDDDGFSLWGVSDHGLNFVVAFVTAGGAPDMVSEVGFLARFAGFAADPAGIEKINRNLHLSVAGLDEGGDIYLIGGVQAAGQFDDNAFSMVLEAWKRDLMVVLQGLSGRASLASAFPAARFEAARKFALNAAPARSAENAEGGEAAQPADLLKAFLSPEHAAKSVCSACAGRGKQGFIARTCGECDGSGFVSRR